MFYGKDQNMNKIKFYAWDDKAEEITLPPIPAIKNVPDYWRKSERFVGSEELAISNNGMPNLGLKHCMPFLDAITSGYHYRLHCDIEVKVINDVPNIFYDSNLTPAYPRAKDHLPTPMGCYEQGFFWQMWWGTSLPEGWSALVTSPLNRPDLPFVVNSGIVDYDKYVAPGNISFYIKKEFEGVIEAGTPIFQIIPIRREAWEMEIDQSLREVGYSNFNKKVEQVYGYYKKSLRQDKPYS